MKVKIFQCDVPSPYTGRMYAKSYMEKSIDKFNETWPDGQYGTIGKVMCDEQISLSELSHKVKSLYMEDDQVFADIEVLNTPHGDMLQNLLDASAVRLSVGFTGKVSNENVVIDADIVSNHFVNKDNNEK